MTSQEYLRALYLKVFGQAPPATWWSENGMDQPTESPAQLLLAEAEQTREAAVQTDNLYLETHARNDLMDSCSSEELTRLWYLKKKFSLKESR